MDGCVLLVCSGADGRFRSLADWTDRTARPGVRRYLFAPAGSCRRRCSCLGRVRCQSPDECDSRWPPTCRTARRRARMAPESSRWSVARSAASDAQSPMAFVLNRPRGMRQIRMAARCARQRDTVAGDAERRGISPRPRRKGGDGLVRDDARATPRRIDMLSLSPSRTCMGPGLCVPFVRLIDLV